MCVCVCVCLRVLTVTPTTRCCRVIYDSKHSRALARFVRGYPIEIPPQIPPLQLASWAFTCHLGILTNWVLFEHFGSDTVPFPYFWSAPMTSARLALIIFLHVVLTTRQPPPCSPEHVQAVATTIQDIISTLGTPPFLSASIQLWSCITIAAILAAANLLPTADNIALYADVVPTCSLNPGDFRALSGLRARADGPGLTRRLQDAIDVLRELQLMVDCDPSSDHLDELASNLMWFSELELHNACNVLSPDTMAPPAVLPSAPATSSATMPP